MDDFKQIAKSQRPRSVAGEFWQFLGETKKWWLLPIVLLLAAFGILIALSSTAVAPFIYTLF